MVRCAVRCACRAAGLTVPDLRLALPARLPTCCCMMESGLSHHALLLLVWLQAVKVLLDLENVNDSSLTLSNPVLVNLHKARGSFAAALALVLLSASRCPAVRFEGDLEHPTAGALVNLPKASKGLLCSWLYSAAWLRPSVRGALSTPVLAHLHKPRACCLAFMLPAVVMIPHSWAVCSNLFSLLAPCPHGNGWARGGSQAPAAASSSTSL